MKQNINYKKIVTLKDTLNVPILECGEPMMILDKTQFKIEYRKFDMIEATGDNMYARKSVVEKLKKAQQEMKLKNSNWQFLIAYAYRTPEIQEKYFKRKLSEVKISEPDLSEAEQIELAHSMVAHPDSAGHTTGGAVDITIWDNKNGQELDMGSGIAQFGDIAYTLFPDIREQQKSNRLYLQKILMDVGFAPFLGEWWHFSYGDKEWAFYYKKDFSIYQKIVDTSFTRC